MRKVRAPTRWPCDRDHGKILVDGSFFFFFLSLHQPSMLAPPCIGRCCADVCRHPTWLGPRWCVHTNGVKHYRMVVWGGRNRCGLWNLSPERRRHACARTLICRDVGDATSGPRLWSPQNATKIQEYSSLGIHRVKVAILFSFFSFFFNDL